MHEDLVRLLFVVHSATTWIMLGAIWYVQIVHYPQFRLIPADYFVAYEKQHQRGIIITVVPWMIFELATGALLLIWPGLFGLKQALIGLILLAGIWFHTFLFQLPRHRLLEKGLKGEVLEDLIRGNWYRTVLWTIRGVLMGYALLRSGS